MHLMRLGVLTVALLSVAVPASASAAQIQPARVEVVDAAGRKVSLARPPQRIVVVGQGPFMVMHLLYMFPECRERLVGYEEKFQSADTFLPLVDPGFSRKVALATNPGAEQIATLHPDLVIMKATVPAQVGQSLAVLGIPVVYFGLEDPERFLREVEMAGTIFGNPARAGEIVRFYQDGLDRIRTRSEAVRKDGQPRVLTLEYSERSGRAAVQVPGRSWIQTMQAQRVGADPIWLAATQGSEGWTVVNFEQIAAWDPDRIFIIPWFTLDQRQVLASFSTDPQWRALRAVKGNEIYLFPSDIFGWDTAEPRWILGMLWLGTKVSPARFGDIDMKDEVYRFFGQMFSMDRAVVDTAIMPRVNLAGR